MSTSPIPSPISPSSVRFSSYGRAHQGETPCDKKFTHKTAAHLASAAAEPVAFSAITQGVHTKKPPEVRRKVSSMRHLQEPASPTAIAVLGKDPKLARPLALDFNAADESRSGSMGAAAASAQGAQASAACSTLLFTPAHFSSTLKLTPNEVMAQELSFDDDSSSVRSFSDSDLSWLSSPSSRGSPQSPPSPLALSEEATVPKVPEAPSSGAPSMDAFRSFEISKTLELPSGHKLEFLASGEHQNVYTVTAGQTPLIPGMDNSLLVVKTFKMSEAGTPTYNRLYKGLFSEAQAQSYRTVKDVVTADYRFAQVYNHPVQDGFSICEKIVHDPNEMVELVKAVKAVQTEEELLKVAPPMKKLQALFTYGLKLAMEGKILDLAKLDNVAFDKAGQRLVVMDLYELGDEEAMGALTHLRRGLKAFAGTVYVKGIEGKHNHVVYTYLVKEFLKFAAGKKEEMQKLLDSQTSEIQANLKALGKQWSPPEGTTFLKKTKIYELNHLVGLNSKDLRGKVDEYHATLCKLEKYEDAVCALTA